MLNPVITQLKSSDTNRKSRGIDKFESGMPIPKSEAYVPGLGFHTKIPELYVL
jgi:hypothetical protein